ncbi:MAG: hypothetical protein HC808_04105 [Candidatus Competibacteraceae bacterium]|nr:hypothetical protein [Candidatus Competibacteraceae bacterium]
MTGESLIFVVAGGLAAAGLFWAWRSIRRAWALADTPIAKIHSAPQGYVELRGRAAFWEGEQLAAPLSGLPCAWYRFRIEENRHNRWWTINHGISDHLFVLEDDTGRCVVDPDGAEVIKTTQDRWYGDRHGGRTFALWGIGAQYRNTEQRIMPGEELHIMGWFETAGGHREPPDIRRQVTELLAQWQKDPRRMALFDRRGNGRIDPDEWEAARRAAYRQVERKNLMSSAMPDVHILSNPEDWSQPFLISTVSERGLINKYRRDALLALLVALLAGAYLAWNGL